MNAIKQQLTAFLSAITLLTRIPLGNGLDFRSETQTASVIYFPIIGMLVGLAGGLVLILTQYFHPILAVLLSMLTTVLITGGFHEDGLADAADGLMGGQTPERRLEIMKDSRIGVYGALALWFSLTLKAILLYELLKHDLWLTFWGIVIAHMLGRTSSVGLIYLHSYVSKENSKFKWAVQKVSRWHFIFGFGAPLFIACFLLSTKALGCVAAMVITMLASGLYFRRKIGGITGDCLGAATQLTELSCYLALLL